MISGLTGVDCPSLGLQVDFRNLQIDCTFGAVQGLFLQVV